MRIPRRRRRRRLISTKLSQSILPPPEYSTLDVLSFQGVCTTVWFSQEWGTKALDYLWMTVFKGLMLTELHFDSPKTLHHLWVRGRGGGGGYSALSWCFIDGTVQSNYRRPWCTDHRRSHVLGQPAISDLGCGHFTGLRYYAAVAPVSLRIFKIKSPLDFVLNELLFWNTDSLRLNNDS